MGQHVENVATALRHIVLNPAKSRLEHLRFGVHTQQLRVQELREQSLWRF